ncbi:MAG: ABC transporter ATP-binding protein [Thermoanaerobaculaceae bacterium]|nr:ABC transporter ATP-binding protein [Thermoanaerobaculaceae bacterium]TAM52998.1 MAG: ABC transporter ATP-binding protein [Acidobacteriota bacterium]
MAAVVELIEVSKSYRRGDELVHALRGVTFTLAGGEMVALVGPSGCGKSTTLNLVAGVDRPDSGAVVVAGADLATAGEAVLVRARRHSIGIVFQSFHLMPHLTVEENIALPLALDGGRDAARVLDLIRRVGLEHRRDHFPAQLSGGEQQRTAVARALVHRPAVVLADEPTGALDSASGAAVLRLMDDLRREEGSALLLATHDEAIAAAADRLIRMRDGAIEAL